MKIVIVGCGRVGSTLAENLDAAGHEVVIFDIRTSAFDRLPETFKGSAVRGDGTDEEVLRAAGSADADIFLALTEGDNRNIMAAQVAAETLGIAKVIAKINDPVRAAAYADLGLVTLSRTNLMVDAVSTYLGLPMETGPGIDLPTDPRHDHPHLTTAGRPTIAQTRVGGAAMTARAAAAEPSASGAAGSSASGAASGPAAGNPRGPVSSPASAEAARTQGLRGFRRWRG